MHTRPSCTQCITTQCTTTHLYSTTTHLQYYKCTHLSACSTNLYYTPACLFSASMSSTCTTDPAAHSVLLHTCTVLLLTYNTTGVHTCLPVLCQHELNMHNRPSCTQCTTTHLYSTTTHLQHYRCPHLSACSTNLYYTPACLFSASMGSTCTTDPAAHSILLHTCTVLLHTYNTTGVHTCLPVLCQHGLQASNATPRRFPT